MLEADTIYVPLPYDCPVIVLVADVKSRSGGYILSTLVIPGVTTGSIILENSSPYKYHSSKFNVWLFNVEPTTKTKNIYSEYILKFTSVYILFKYAIFIDVLSTNNTQSILLLLPYILNLPGEFEEYPVLCFILYFVNLIAIGNLIFNHSP